MSGRRCLCLGALVLVLAAAGLSLGASGAGFWPLLESEAGRRILLYVRVPRVAAAVMAGFALALSGHTLQNALHNPLASPGVTGVNAGAGLGALLAAAIWPAQPLALSCAAFAGALLASGVAYFASLAAGGGRYAVVLAGVAVGSMLTACMDAVVTFAPDLSVDRLAFAIGGFSDASWPRLFAAAPFLAAGALLAGSTRRAADVLTLGDESAASLGLRVPAARGALIAASALLAGGAVSFAGLLGFVGLIVPHMARALLKGRFERTGTALLGACVCLACDTCARTLFSPYELPVGVPLSLLGAPFFLYLLISGRNRA